MRKPKTAQLILVKNINVINPRKRDAVKFQEIVDSISLIGLKRPITVAASKSTNKKYNLICGQGRMEAFLQLGWYEIPAIIVDASEEDCYLMSLVENFARRKPTSLETFQDIERLETMGYDVVEISKKTGLSKVYLRDVFNLINNGEERLLDAVEKGIIPITVAADISKFQGKEMQDALARAYENGDLRGKKLQKAMKIVNQRITQGKSLKINSNAKSSKKINARTIVDLYLNEVKHHKMTILRANQTEQRLLLIKNSMNKLREDENFMTLLRAEQISDYPKYFNKKIEGRGEI